MNIGMFFRRFLAVFIDGILVGVLVNMLGPLGGIVWIVYEVCFLVLWNGQTIGKKILGLHVTPTPDWGKAIVRTLMKIVSGLPLCLGYLWMLWDPLGQTWHDKIAGTNVE
jgi:uncharacterized RDD family membrane protein YckC